MASRVQEFEGAGPGPGSRGRLFSVVAIVVGLPLAAAVILTWERQAPPKPTAALKAIATAQLDFRSGDRDGNGQFDYWRQDVQGLYSLVHPESGDEIGLITLPIAEADDRPAARFGGLVRGQAYEGYWFRSLRFADESSPSPDRFAVLAFPSEPAGRLMYAVSEKRVVWQKPAVRGGLDLFPADPAAEGWAALTN